MSKKRKIKSYKLERFHRSLLKAAGWISGGVSAFLITKHFLGANRDYRSVPYILFGWFALMALGQLISALAALYDSMCKKCWRPFVMENVSRTEQVLEGRYRVEGSQESSSAEVRQMKKVTRIERCVRSGQERKTQYETTV